MAEEKRFKIEKRGAQLYLVGGAAEEQEFPIRAGVLLGLSEAVGSSEVEIDSSAELEIGIEYLRAARPYADTRTAHYLARFAGRQVPARPKNASSAMTLLMSGALQPPELESPLGYAALLAAVRVAGENYPIPSRGCLK